MSDTPTVPDFEVPVPDMADLVYKYQLYGADAAIFKYFMAEIARLEAMINNKGGVA